MESYLENNYLLDVSQTTSERESIFFPHNSLPPLPPTPPPPPPPPPSPNSPDTTLYSSPSSPYPDTTLYSSPSSPYIPSSSLGDDQYSSYRDDQNSFYPSETVRHHSLSSILEPDQRSFSPPSSPLITDPAQHRGVSPDAPGQDRSDSPSSPLITDPDQHRDDSPDVPLNTDPGQDRSDSPPFTPTRSSTPLIDLAPENYGLFNPLLYSSHIELTTPLALRRLIKSEGFVTDKFKSKFGECGRCLQSIVKSSELKKCYYCRDIPTSKTIYICGCNVFLGGRAVYCGSRRCFKKANYRLDSWFSKLGIAPKPRIDVSFDATYCIICGCQCGGGCHNLVSDKYRKQMIDLFNF